MNSWVRSFRRSRAGWAGALLAVGVLNAGCTGSATAPPAAEAAASAASPGDGTIVVAAGSPLRKTIRVAPAERQQVERPILVPGVVEADPAHLVKLVPPVGGRIVALDKMLGDAVAAGDALVAIDSAELAQARSDAAKAAAALALAQRSLQRQRELAADGIAARKDLEQAESDFAQAESESQRAQARLAQLGAGADRALVLRSPIAGRVVELNAARGGFWNDTNAPLMTVADLSTVWVTAGVRERDLASVFVGQAVKIAFDAYEGELLDGKVRYVGELLDPDTRTVKVRIALANRAGRFRPGMFAKLTFAGAAHPAVVVPATALVQNGFGARVFVETAPWTFKPRVVKNGAQIGDRIEIVEGLEAGERIVVNDGVLLGD